MKHELVFHQPIRVLSLAGFLFLITLLPLSSLLTLHADASESATATPNQTTSASAPAETAVPGQNKEIGTPALSGTSAVEITPSLMPSETQEILISETASALIATTTSTLSPATSTTPTPTEPMISPSSTASQPPSAGTALQETATPATLLPTASLSATVLPSPSPTETATSTPYATSTGTPPPATTPYPLQSVLINEIAWAGTIASANDEWIELFNNSSGLINLSGWTLSDGGDINIALTGTIPARSFFLLERTDDSTITNILANMIYTGNLKNSGETLRLQDPTGASIDRANAGGGSWPAGDSSTRGSMERRGTGEHWTTFGGSGGNGQDAAGNAIQGTPGQPNSPLSPPPSPSPEATQTPTLTPTSPPTFPPLSVIINEVAWAGTIASSSDEWIELYNPGTNSLSLDGWTLSDGGDINIALRGKINAQGYFLLERTDDSAVANISADLIYRGSLSNRGETLWLRDPSGALVDSANSFGSAWPAGSSSTKASMEREGGADLAGNWETFTGYFGTGNDAAGNPIKGTPRNRNSLLFPTPAPTWVPGAIRINEVLIRPHFDWEGKGGVDTGDEYIEIINIGPGKVFLKGWYLDDIADGGSRPYKIKGVTLKPGSMVAFFKTETHITLNDSGDTVRLLAPNGRVVDEISYLKVRARNLSYGRLPDGSGHLAYGLWPTPGESNLLFVEPFIPTTGLPIACPESGVTRIYLMRHARHPAQERWLKALGFGICE